MPGVGCTKEDKKLLAEKEKPQETKDNKTELQPQKPSEASVGILALPLIGRAVLGATEGAEAGGAAGTVEPGGGNVVGAIGGAIIGGAVAALAPTIYSKSKDAVQKVGSQVERALKHLEKLGGPDRNPNPRRGWKQTVRNAANQLDKQADRVANKNVANGLRLFADFIRGAIE